MRAASSTLALALALLSFTRVEGQAVFPAANGEALAGVSRVDAQALVLNWLDLEGDRGAFGREADRAFRAALPSFGVQVDGDVSHFLFCELKLAGAGGAVVYSWAVGLYEFVVGGAHRLQWTTGGIVRVGRANFSPRVAVEECAEGFRREWTRWNPPDA